MTTRRTYLRAAAGCIVGILLLLLLILGDEPGSDPAFRLQAIKQLQQGGTNQIIFRLISLDRVEVLQYGPGHICDPLDPQAAFSTRYGLMSQGPPAQCPTNFVGTKFRTQTEFAIFAPSNDLWRLDVLLLRQESFAESLRKRGRETWNYAIRWQLAPIPKIWTRPWRVTINYHIPSHELTNALPESSAL